MARRFEEFSRSRRERRRKPVLFIICEGSETEVNYFKRFRSRDSLIEIRPFVSKHKSVLSLVEHARDLIKQEPYYPEDGDQLWCVFDRNGNTNEQLAKAETMAARLNYKIVFSNPCFELWFLLHFTDQRGYLEDAGAVIRLLDAKDILPGYKKSGNYYDVLRPLQSVAAGRAHALAEIHGSDRKTLIHRDANPCTTAVLLVEYLAARKENAASM